MGDRSKTIIDNAIEVILASMAITKISNGEIQLSEKTTLAAFLRSIPEETLLVLSGLQGTSQPSIGTDEWIDWFITTRKTLGVSRKQILSRVEEIDKSALSNFENKNKNFGLKRRSKLLNALKDITQRG